MSDEIWLAKHGNMLQATDKESTKHIDEMEEGECQCFEPIGVRDEVAFRRYWVMCTHISKHVRKIEIDRIDGCPVYMPISGREDVSEAIKMGVGFYVRLPIENTNYAIRKVKSISWPSMSPNKWKKYIRRVAPFVVEKIMPEIEDPCAKDELAKLLNKWLLEVEREGAQEQAA